MWRNKEEVERLRSLPLDEQVQLLRDLIAETEEDGMHYEGAIHDIGCLALDLFRA